MPDRLVSDEQLDVVLAASDPLAPGRLEGPGVAQGLAQLRASVLSSEGTARPTRRPPRLRRRFVVGFGVAAVAIAAALVGVTGSGGNSSGSSWLVTVTPAQASQLDGIAGATLQQAGPRQGQWLYQRYQTFIRGGFPWTGGAFVGYHRSSMTQQWTSSRTQRFRIVQMRFAFNTPRDRATFLKYRSHFLPELRAEGPLKPGSVTDTAAATPPSTAMSPRLVPQEFPDTKLGILNRFKQLIGADEARLPPSKFRTQFKAQLASGLFGVLVMILEKSTSERQRAAALKALEYVRGLQMLGDRRDVRGRNGLAIRSVGYSVETLIVDRRTGNLLQDTAENFQPANQYVSVVRTVYLQRAVVKSMTALPDGRSVPYHHRASSAAGEPGK